jgi:hypothetical protein
MLARTVSAGVARTVRGPSVATGSLTVRCSAVSFFSLSTPRMEAAKKTTSVSVQKEFKRWAANQADQQPNSFITKPLEGPISPHFLIYRFPLPGLTSGAHRATGFALTLSTFQSATRAW